MATSTISSTAQKELDNIAQIFQLSNDHLVQITKGYGEAFRHGLQVPNQPIVMSPSFVTTVPNGSEKGTFLALDINWNSFQVSKVELDGKRSFKAESQVFDISSELMKADAIVFFDYLAQSIHTFLKEKSIKKDGLTLGFTFPFAAQKSSLDHANLLGWSKGFSIKGAEGKDVVQLLQDALNKAQVDIKCTAIVNDTVAALLSESYLSVPCLMSAIYSTGTNGSYSEQGAAITKLPQLQGSSMMINTEWGAFSQKALLGPNMYDEKLDNGSVHPGTYLFQKMTCWFYLGELLRIILLSLVERSPPLLFNGVVSGPLKKQRGFSTFHLFQIEDAKDLKSVKELIVENLEYSKDAVSDQDAEIVRFLATVVAARAAKLAACPVAALLTHLGYATATGGGKLPIAADGEFFIGSAQFETRFKQSVGLILGRDFEKRVEFHMIKGGGTIGAALAAYVAANA